jgi:tRNA(Arg) A34 adenosine deaminase TadA
LTVWRTDEPCPVCAAGLFIVGYGRPVQVAECRLCGWSETWDLTDDTDTGNGGDAR